MIDPQFPGVQLLDEWIPDQMTPGTIFLLENPGAMGEARNPFWAVLSCPRCGTIGLITRTQFGGRDAIICGSDDCSAEFHLQNERIFYRKPN